MSKETFIKRCIELSKKSLDNNDGPFGALITKNNDVIAESLNKASVQVNQHAEILVLNKAHDILGTTDLSECTLYSNCEPCPMCLSAIYWAHIDKIYYGNTRKDAAKIGFDDNFIYDELSIDLNKRKIPLKQINQKEALIAFKEWELKEDKIKY